MTIGDRISKLRKEKKLSQEYIAEMLNVSRQAVSKWENGLSAPDTGNLIQLSALFGVSVEYLACGTGEEEPVASEKQKEPRSVYDYLGISLIIIGVISAVVGAATLWELIAIGVLLVVYGGLVSTLRKDGIYLSLAMLVLAALLLLVQGLTGGLDIPLCCLIFAVSVIVPLAVYVGVKLAMRRMPTEEQRQRVKNIAVVLVAVLSVIAIVLSVNLVIKNNTKDKREQWFSELTLARHNLVDLPIPKTQNLIKLGTDTVLAHLGSAESDYMKELYVYLCSRNFSYLRTRGNAFDGGDFELKECRKLSDYATTDRNYIFVYSYQSEAALDGDIACYILQLEYVGELEVTVGGERYLYDTVISVREEIPGEENYRFENHSLTYLKDVFDNPPKKAMAGREIVLKAPLPETEYFEIIINKDIIVPERTDDGLLTFTFIMPDGDVTVGFRE